MAAFFYVQKTAGGLSRSGDHVKGREINMAEESFPLFHHLFNIGVSSKDATKYMRRTGGKWSERSAKMTTPNNVSRKIYP